MEMIFLQDLAVVMIVAGLVTVVFHRLKQPVVLGYILAGLIIGPHTPPFPLIHEQETIRTLAELGVILLMFSLGLEFSLKKLKRVGWTAFVVAFLEILLMFWVGYEIGRWFEWSTMDSIFLGAMLSISSTTIIIKALAELGKSKEQFAELILGVLIIEDVLAIVMLALLSGIAMTGGLTAAKAAATVGKLVLFLVVALVVGLITVPRLISYVAKFKSNETLLITALGLCFGFSLLAAHLGYSVALGAFMIGALVAESREIGRIETLCEPVRDMFSAIFFVAIGLMIQPKMLATHWLPILVITGAVVVGKIVSCTFGALVAGNDSRTSLRVGMGLAQIGEFSFIIAALGLSLKVTSDFLYPIAVAVSAITTLITPYLIRSSDKVIERVSKLAPRSLLNSVRLYTRWVGQLENSRHRSMAARLLRRWVYQIALNLVLIAAVFAGSAFLSRRPPGWLKDLRLDPGVINGALWFGAVLVSLPLLIATFRKLQALGLLISELRTSPAGAQSAAVQAIVARLVPYAGTVLLAFYVFLLSSALLPSARVVVGLAILIAFITWWLWRSFIRIYSKAQVALQETLAQAPATRHAPSHTPLQGLLREANLELMPVNSGFPAAGRLIRELQLRTLTGASIVGIERQGGNVVNPGPDEEVQVGDQLLVLGTRGQLDAARVALSMKGGSTGEVSR
jgi:CPA2 family monovalent cation:H+ antiporter-2